MRNNSDKQHKLTSIVIIENLRIHTYFTVLTKFLHYLHKSVYKKIGILNVQRCKNYPDILPRLKSWAFSALS